MLYKYNCVCQLFLNWTGSDPESGIYDYEVGLASTTSEAEVADISEYTSTHHHSFYRNHHPTLAEESPFYILIRATNKAGLQAVKVGYGWTHGQHDLCAGISK